MSQTLFPAASPETRARLEQDPLLKFLNGYDWSANPLGPIPDWTEALRAAVRTIMVSKTPSVLLVGADGILIYNTGYAEFAGPRHPDIFGMRAVDAWPEIAEFNRENVARGLRGEGLSLIGQQLDLNRHGMLETVWLDLHYSPLLDEAGTPFGTICMVVDTTHRVLAERAMMRSEERLSLALNGSGLVGTWDWDVLNDLVTADDRFALMYNLDPLQAGIGIEIGQFLAAVHADDRPGLEDAIGTAIRDGSDFRHEYRLVSPNGAVRWVVASGKPRQNAEGRTTRFPGVVFDVTEQRKTSEALAESELRFRTLADAMPQMVWSTLPDGFHDYYNARWYEFTGVPVGSTDGEGWNNMFHPDDQEHAWAVWRNSLETGEPYEIEYRLRHHSGEYRWTLGLALPIRDASGTIIRWIGTCTDIHAAKLAAEERELVAQELSHRIKNIFAVLTGIIGLSARSHPEIKPFADDLRQRIFALGEAHDFVRPHSSQSRPTESQTSLAALIGRLMRAYASETGARVRYEGEDAEIDEGAATPLALLFHELGTNSAKYGALSRDDGYVTITGRSGENAYRLTWKEHGGPAVTPPASSTGFGTRLIGLSVEGQMRGKVERHWDADGLRVDIELPLQALRRSARLQQHPN